MTASKIELYSTFIRQNWQQEIQINNIKHRVIATKGTILLTFEANRSIYCVHILHFKVDKQIQFSHHTQRISSSADCLHWLRILNKLSFRKH